MSSEDSSRLVWNRQKEWEEGYDISNLAIYGGDLSLTGSPATITTPAKEYALSGGFDVPELSVETGEGGADSITATIQEIGSSGGVTGEETSSASAQTLLNEGFEDGAVDPWTNPSGMVSVVSDRSHSGSYSLYCGDGVTEVPHTISTISPSGLDGGEKISSFEFFYQETTNSTGGGLRLVNSSGNYEVGAATNNPEWVISDANGDRTVNTEGSSYDEWVRVKLDFNWTEGSFQYEFEALSDGNVETGTGDLSYGQDVESVFFENYAGGWIPSYIDMWIDDISVVGGESSVGGSISFNGENFGSPIDEYRSYRVQLEVEGDIFSPVISQVDLYETADVGGEERTTRDVRDSPSKGGSPPVWELALDWDYSFDESAVAHDAAQYTNHEDESVVKKGYKKEDPHAAEDLAGYWPLQENEAGTAHNLISGGTDLSTTNVSIGHGGPLGNRYYSFDRPGGYQEYSYAISDGAPFSSVDHPIGFSLCFRPDRMNQGGVLLHVGEFGMSLSWDGNTQGLDVNIYGEDQAGGHGPSGLEHDHWHLAVMYWIPGTEFGISVDGSDYDVYSTAGSLDANDFISLGRELSSGSPGFNGDLQEVKAWERAPTEAEAKHMWEIVNGSGDVHTTRKEFDYPQQPGLAELQYDGTLTATVVGSPGTSSEETTSQTLEGETEYSLPWSSSHTEFEMELSLQSKTVLSGPQADSIQLVPNSKEIPLPYYESGYISSDPTILSWRDQEDFENATTSGNFIISNGTATLKGGGAQGEMYTSKKSANLTQGITDPEVTTVFSSDPSEEIDLTLKEHTNTGELKESLTRTVSQPMTTNTYSFEDGTFQGWSDPTSIGSVDTTTGAVGSNSLYFTSDSSPPNIWTEKSVAPEGEDLKIDSLEFYYKETTNSQGHGVRVFDSSGSTVAAFATNNPQWLVHDRGMIQVYSPSDLYNTWVRVKFEFDWDGGWCRWEIESTETAHSDSGRKWLDGNGINLISVQNYGGGWGGSNSADSWVDGFSIEYQNRGETESVTQFSDGDFGGAEGQRLHYDLLAEFNGVGSESLELKDVTVEEMNTANLDDRRYEPKEYNPRQPSDKPTGGRGLSIGGRDISMGG